MKKLLASLFLLPLFLITPGGFWRPVYAEGEFNARYNVNYEVDTAGLTSVTYRVDITNLTTQYYVSEYDLTIPSEKIQEVTAADRRGAIKPEITKLDDSTKIHLVFNEKTIGRGSIMSFAFSYQSPEIAKKNGRIWEISLPAKSESPEITGYTVNLKVPESFGKPSYLSPEPTAGLSWTGDQLKGGVIAAFGDYQLFRFNLSYHLANPKVFPVFTEIAIPADNGYQRVKLDEIKPKPVKVRQDEDGNWMARYNLSSGEKKDVLVSGVVKILPFPDPDYPKKKESPQNYLVAQKYWEVKDPEIQRLASELKTPQAIYNFVVSTLKYDYQKAKGGGKRLGAKEVLKNPKNAICMEFTDLFIALARSAGIPAREVDGFAYTANPKLQPLSLEKDILHAWPEFWDKERQLWIAVDPTWGKTTGGIDYFQKLDFNHFALVIKGVSSELPLPAGAYKLDGEEGKDVEVGFEEGNWQETNPQYEVLWNTAQWVFAGFGLAGSVEVKNIGQSAVYDQEVNLGSQPEGLIQAKPWIVSLAPGESYKLNLDFKKPGWFEKFQGTLVLTIGRENFPKPFEVKSFGWIAVILVVTLGMIGGFVIFYLFGHGKN